MKLFDLLNVFYGNGKNIATAHIYDSPKPCFSSPIIYNTEYDPNVTLSAEILCRQVGSFEAKKKNEIVVYLF